MRGVSKKDTLQRSKYGIHQITICAVFLVLCILSPVMGKSDLLCAADEKKSYLDKAGREAFMLWAEREKDRAIAEATRRYWDYWLSNPSRHYSAYRQWMELDQTQKWLKDPKHHPPPPLPPPPLFSPYSYPNPYLYYHPGLCWGFPPFWPSSPYYFYSPYFEEPSKGDK